MLRLVDKSAVALCEGVYNLSGDCSIVIRKIAVVAAEGEAELFVWDILVNFDDDGVGHGQSLGWSKGKLVVFFRVGV